MGLFLSCDRNKKKPAILIEIGNKSMSVINSVGAKHQKKPPFPDGLFKNKYKRVKFKLPA